MHGGKLPYIHRTLPRPGSISNIKSLKLLYPQSGCFHHLRMRAALLRGLVSKGVPFSKAQPTAASACRHNHGREQSKRLVNKQQAQGLQMVPSSLAYCLLDWKNSTHASKMHRSLLMQTGPNANLSRRLLGAYRGSC